MEKNVIVAEDFEGKEVETSEPECVSVNEYLDELLDSCSIPVEPGTMKTLFEPATPGADTVTIEANATALREDYGFSDEEVEIATSMKFITGPCYVGRDEEGNAVISLTNLSLQISDAVLRKYGDMPVRKALEYMFRGIDSFDMSNIVFG